jgi:hypothetical protein
MVSAIGIRWGAAIAGRNGAAFAGLSDTRERPGAGVVPGRITGRGHRRPRLYRTATLTFSSLGFKYPGGFGGRAPKGFALINSLDRGLVIIMVLHRTAARQQK